MTNVIDNHSHPPAGPAQPDPPAPEPDAAGHGPRALLHRLHVIAGILVAPFLVAAVSGLIYAVAPALEPVLYREALTATSPAPARPLAEQIAVAQEIHPDLAFSAVQVPAEEGATTRVLFADPTLPKASYRRAVFIDPGDLAVKGDIVQLGATRALPMRAWASEGHRTP